MQAGYNDLSTQYGQGRDALTTGYNGASNAYNNLLGSSTAGANAYGDASGANGAAGLQNATNNFKNSGQYGAYGFSLNQGLQALDRTHAAAGNLNSGNADADTMNYATGLAGQQYNNYLQGLNPYLGQQSSATAGVANADAGLGTALNSSYQGQGAAANANQTAQGASTAAATMNNYNVGANQLGALTSGLQLAFGMPSLSGVGSSGGAPGSQVAGTFGPSSYGGASGPTPVTGGSLFSMFS